MRNLSNLKDNNIGYTGDGGLTALGTGFRDTPNLQTFLFIPQAAVLSPAVMAPLNQGLQYTKAGPLSYLLLTEEEVQNYVANLSRDTTTIDLTRRLSSPSPSLFQTLVEGIKMRGLNITDLRLQNIGLDSPDSSSIQRLGELLPLLPNLTLLDLSNNYIGFTSDEGTIALGKVCNGFPACPLLI